MERPNNIHKCYCCDADLSIAEIPLEDQAVNAEADFIMTHQCKTCGYIWYPIWLLEEIVDENTMLKKKDREKNGKTGKM